MFADCDKVFWLDSSKVESGLSRFSFMGAANGPWRYRCARYYRHIVYCYMYVQACNMAWP